MLTMQYNIPASLLAIMLIFMAILYFLWVKRYAVAGLVFLYCIIFFIEPVLRIPKISYFIKWGLYIGLILVWSLWVSARRFKYGSIKYHFPFIASFLFITTALFSGFLSKNMAESVFRALTFILLFLIAYVIVPADTVENRIRDFFTSIYVFDGVLLFICICGLPVSSFWWSGRFGGMTQNANAMAIIAYTLLILSLVALSRPNSRRLVHYTVAAFCFLVLVITRSRGGYLATLGGMLTFWFLTNKKLFRILLALVLLVPILAAPLEVNWGEIFTTVVRGETLSEIGSGRWEQAQMAWKMFLEHPIIGAGLGGGGIANKSDAGSSLGVSQIRLGGATGYLAILYETGIVGFSFYFTWLFITIYAGWSRYKLALGGQAEISPAVWAGVLALFIAYGLHGLVEGFPSGAGSYVSARIWYMAGIFVYYFQKVETTTAQAPNLAHLTYRPSQDYQQV